MSFWQGLNSLVMMALFFGAVYWLAYGVLYVLTAPIRRAKERAKREEEAPED